MVTRCQFGVGVEFAAGCLNLFRTSVFPTFGLVSPQSPFADSGEQDVPLIHTLCMWVFAQGGKL